MFGRLKKRNTKPVTYPDIVDQDFLHFMERCSQFTMTSVERMYALYNSVNYVVKNDIKGDFVECGVWKGGSSLLIALTLQKLNVNDRKIYLYDTFEGMSEPTASDVDFSGTTAEKQLNESEIANQHSVWCYSTLNEVKANFENTGIEMDKVLFIKGKVEDTIPAKKPEEICLLRLDTDWYESTKHELIHLYPNLSQNGVLIIDDYGHWQGCRKAVDEYFSEQQISPLLNRIDYTGRLMIKL